VVDVVVEVAVVKTHGVVDGSVVVGAEI